jgi:hypothetical protein
MAFSATISLRDAVEGEWVLADKLSRRERLLGEMTQACGTSCAR